MGCKWQPFVRSWGLRLPTPGQWPRSRSRRACCSHHSFGWTFLRPLKSLVGWKAKDLAEQMLITVHMSNAQERIHGRCQTLQMSSKNSAAIFQKNKSFLWCTSFSTWPWCFIKAHGDFHLQGRRPSKARNPSRWRNPWNRSWHGSRPLRMLGYMFWQRKRSIVW